MSPTAAALRRVTAALDAAEDRPGQLEMAEAVADAIHTERHLVVQAGTGTGKTLAYLVPAIRPEKTVVVATATKALQDQLAAKDLPFLEEHLGAPFTWAVLKGRSNYLCRQRLAEVESTEDGQLELEELGDSIRNEVRRLSLWATTCETGDQADLDWAPSERAWKAVSVGSDECPGASRCDKGGSCFAERARQQAAEANVVVVNLHLYGLHVASEGALLPEHDVVVFDEAHQLEDVMSDTVGTSVGPGRLTNFAASLRRVLQDDRVVATLLDLATRLQEALEPRAGERLGEPLPVELRDVLLEARQAVNDALDALRPIETKIDDVKQRVLRCQMLANRLAAALDVALGSHEGSVAFVGGVPKYPRLEIAPLDVGPVLAEGVWAETTAVLTSATLPASLARRVGLTAGSFDQLDVGSPFDYEHHGLLYCAMHLPTPRDPGFAAGTHDELEALITAAGGRTLALFTSWKAMDAAAEALSARVPFPIITQREKPKTALIREFSENDATCLFATAGFFQGVDIPGQTLSLVVIDRLPFPRPDDPLLSARRELLGRDAFAVIDVPRAATLLAQATGRLIRNATDRGVVAVLDPRLAKASYRWDIVRALPPMRRTRDRSEAEAFLRAITGDAAAE